MTVFYHDSFLPYSYSDTLQSFYLFACRKLYSSQFLSSQSLKDLNLSGQILSDPLLLLKFLPIKKSLSIILAHLFYFCNIL